MQLRQQLDRAQIHADLSTIDGVDKVLAAVGGRRIDLLCANAGQGLGHGFLDRQVSDWRMVVDTNITGTIYLVQNVLKDMVARNDGKVLVPGSVLAEQHRPMAGPGSAKG